MKTPKKKAKTFKESLNALYTGAWNQLELDPGSKQALINSGYIIIGGLITAITILNKNKWK
jgi:hypothetical protein